MHAVLGWQVHAPSMCILRSLWLRRANANIKICFVLASSALKGLTFVQLNKNVCFGYALQQLVSQQGAQHLSDLDIKKIKQDE